jgi:hypothetical protein
MPNRVIMFVFAGRRGNMECQVPMVRRILDENPNVEYHVWNLTGNKDDNAYVRDIVGERITVVNDLHGRGGPSAFKAVYRHYAQSEYEDCLFVKLDDDIVFLQTARFGAFIAAIDAHRGYVVSAHIVNNGACAPLEPALWEGFTSLAVPLLDIHKQNQYAEIAHDYFFEHHQELLDQPVELIPTEDWLSINTVGYDWSIAREIAARLGKVPHPSFIAGRNFPAPWGLMDEGMVNLLPRMIMRGFVACHLTFGPQHCTGDQCDRWRERYAEVGRQYLAGRYENLSIDHLPGLSPVSCMYRGAPRIGWGVDMAERGGHVLASGENNPCAGRFLP